MAKHKAATEITIAQEERSAFAAFTDRYKWHGLAVLAAIGMGILWQQRASNEAVESNRSDWARLYAAQLSDDVVTSLASAVRDIERSDVTVWAQIGQTLALVDDRAYPDAVQVLSQAIPNSPDLLTRVTFPVGPDGAEQTLMEHLTASLEAERQWAEDNPNIFENPAPPEGSPEVELETDRGIIRIALYMNEAPAHVKNFMKLVEEGYYDNTRFHRVVTGGFIQGGDPNSREDDAASWGLGGPDTQIPSEKNSLIHAKGVLAAAKKGGATDSSGSQFYITCSPQHQFDGRYVVYGKVLEGLEIVEDISNGEIRTDKRETPVEPVRILSTRVL